ncbi:tetratricopeptide repeat family protein [Synechococcus sp. MEDNS5]|uniref:hypothetical protein n=1 Tax=Synechococcus sp. MEDNS5 TaxID=1442554 RepID=UPI00164433E8|nr:hypothetical protein [Synechococcus sp. MEDNS5]QNJ04808.1 tetratricopeptide repeat family protein [Synechococcus sp. MEDNS5]
MRLVSSLVLGGLLISSMGCGKQSNQTAPTEAAEVAASECLENLNLKRLDAALDRCNLVVRAHRSNPAPLVDRSLIFNLMKRPEEACNDVAKAARLLKKGQQKPDPMLLHELSVRQQSCKLRATIAGND